MRINAAGSALAEEDLAAVVGANLSGLRLPKTEAADGVRRVAEALEGSGSGAVVQCLIESALGLELVFEIARSHARVAGVGLGEADLAADLGARGDAGLFYARSRLVAASRAAGLPGPVQSVYTSVRDLDGLRRTTEEGRDMGFFGRSAIHPAQVPVINEVFTPTEDEISGAEDLLARLEESAGRGTGAFVLEDGRFVDEAVVASARATLNLARRAPEATGGEAL
nr:aldolase/citrate lyase family protein [Rubrobacter marinus]